MTSEIRANTIKNRVGLGTIEYSNTGPVISGVTTAFNFKTGTSNLHSTGLNIFDLDVDGHTNLDNVSVAGVTTATGNLNISSGDLKIGGNTVINSGRALYNLEQVKLAASKELIFPKSELYADCCVLLLREGFSVNPSRRDMPKLIEIVSTGLV